MAQLKAETAALHRGIEQVVPLMRPTLDRLAYRSYLARLLGYLRPLEEQLARFSGALRGLGVDFEARRKTPLVVRDLLFLGHDPHQLEAVPSCRHLPAADSLAEAVGCLYVLEGSTLGGQVILRTLGPRLSLTANEGLAFLTGYAEQTGTSWRAFAESVGRFDLQGADRAAVVRGARETFATQLEWFAGGGAAWVS